MEDQSQGMYNQHSDSQNVISGMGHPPMRPAYPVAYPGAYPGRVCVIVACPHAQCPFCGAERRDKKVEKLIIVGPKNNIKMVTYGVGDVASTKTKK
uniref:Uncharacterized protein n=1 Tax=Lutzomyia longipalpis TaxID=7200 RepID=A0A1B0EVB3_LUTLO